MHKTVFHHLGLMLSALCLTLASIAATAQDKMLVTLNMREVPLETAMNSIKRQTNYLFVNRNVDTRQRVSVSVENAAVRDALTALLNPIGVDFNIEGTSIIIYPRKQVENSAPRVVSGQILDSRGEPVMGAGVFVKGTSNGAVTDSEGRFSLTIPSEQLGGTLVFSCLGYSTVEMPVGSRSQFQVVLEEESTLLEGTVVTALGIRRSEKALSYNVQKVDAEQFLTNKDANFVNSLNGKVAGLVINASSSGTGGASKVVMRGQKSITKTSNALYVIDGVPMYTTALEAGTEFGSQGQSDPIADLNPEDIESLTVLTGAAAAALYGSSAANGAIVVTTKKGAAGKTSITFSSNTELSEVAFLPSFQNSYGTGDLNSVEGSSVRSWGAKLSDVSKMGYSPRSDYFQYGLTGTESVSISTGTERNQTYFSAAAVNNRGIVPNNAYNRYNFNFRNTTSFLSDKLLLDVSASYVMQNDRNMTNQGLYNNPVVGAYLFPRGNDWDDVKMYERWDNTRKIFTQYWPSGDAGITMQNPYWINYRNLRTNDKKRYTLSGALTYDITDYLKLSGRVKVDNTYNQYQEKFYATTNTQLTGSSVNGLYSTTEMRDRKTYADVLLTFNKTVARDWTVNVNLGASVTDMKFYSLKNGGPIADGIIDPVINIPNVFNVFAIAQSRLDKAQSGWREQQQSLYGQAEIGWKGAYYLTLAGRNDWPSQLAGPRSVNKSFFYPSVGASVVLSQALDLPEQIEYLKVRSSFASVGNAFSRFVANPMHEWSNNTSSWTSETAYPMDRLKPERTDSWEAGLSARFLDGFSLEATWYNTHTKNQTFFPGISTGSGYSEIAIQSGDVLNTGVELSLGYEKSWGKFGWSTSYTFSANRNEIKSLADDAVNPVTGEPLNISSLNMGGLGNARFILTEGGTLGDIYSRADLKRDNKDAIYVDATGNIATQTIQKTEDYIKMGSVLPKSNMAWRNDFHFGNFSLGALITARFGGVVYSRTQAMLDFYGVSKASADARDKGGVLINGSDLIDANKWYSAVGGGDTVPQFYTYSADNVRLQEASIGYTIPRKKLGGLFDINLQIVGRNLLMIWCKAPFDPEAVASTTDNYYQGIDYFMMPNTRNYGFNVRINF